MKTAQPFSPFFVRACTKKEKTLGMLYEVLRCVAAAAAAAAVLRDAEHLTACSQTATTHVEKKGVL